MEGISWESQTKRLNKNKPWTLVHGDFWPGNVLVSTPLSKTNEPNLELRILDWEMVGIGSGPQELGQYVISNMTPVERRSCEKTLVRNYYEELIRSKNSNIVVEEEEEYTWETCWEEYKIGGIERWIWFLVYFCGRTNMIEWAQFFHDQMAEFVKDHQLTPDNVTQPRP